MAKMTVAEKLAKKKAALKSKLVIPESQLLVDVDAEASIKATQSSPIPTAEAPTVPLPVAPIPKKGIVIREPGSSSRVRAPSKSDPQSIPAALIPTKGVVIREPILAPRQRPPLASSREPASKKARTNKGKGKATSTEDAVETLAEIYGVIPENPVSAPEVVAHTIDVPSVIDNNPPGVGVDVARRVCLDRDMAYLLDYSSSSTFEKGCQWSIMALQAFHSLCNRNIAFDQLLLSMNFSETIQY